ncbi:hypothetical protein [Massilia brevitalea]|uniref:hypothetical protein n=1 Tax=Massilia brevitalea TaxID=442526 RepID=UPI00273A1C68|nr:hypothetical protein [Massilia brevitalea]
MPLDNSCLGRARSAAHQSQNPSISALQRVLRIGHSEASSLVAQLQDEDMLLARMTGRQPRLHPDYRRHVVRRITGNERLCHVRMVVQTALLCFELDEEAIAGDSAVLKLHAPPGANWRVLRTLFMEDWYSKQGLSLTDAALAYHEWLQERGPSPADCSGLAQAIRTECLPYERPRVDATASATRLARAYVRLARYYKRSLAEGGSRDTRIAEYYVRNAVVPQNAKSLGRIYPEHVVPCAVLRDTATAAFEAGASVRDVAEWIESMMVVTWIAKTEARYLDSDLGWKDRMPPDWQPASGCRYARLHDAKIPFTPAISHPCTCK